MSKLGTIEGIGDMYAEKFAAIGIKTCEDFLLQGASKKGREELARKTGISDKLILKWINHADLIDRPSAPRRSRACPVCSFYPLYRGF